jgi:hypothetical protein
VIDDQTCMVEFALRTISFYQHESCGWCIPCREGTDWLKKSLTRFHAGFGEAKDIDNIQYLAENMLGRTFCPLGDAAAMPTVAFVKKFRKEFEDHLNGKPCPFAFELACNYSRCRTSNKRVDRRMKAREIIRMIEKDGWYFHCNTAPDETGTSHGSNTRQ